MQRTDLSKNIYLTKSETDGIFLHWKFHSLGGGVQLISDSSADTFTHAYHASVQSAQATLQEQLRVAVECLKFYNGLGYGDAKHALQQIAAMDGVAKQEQVKV